MGKGILAWKDKVEIEKAESRKQKIMIIPILTFAAFVVVHALIFGLCLAARRGDEAMEEWIKTKQKLGK